MSMVAPAEIVVPEDVLAEVKRRSAEVEFRVFREVIADHFSDAKSIEIYVLDDPDEDDRCWVVFQVVFPADAEIDDVLQKRTRFYEDLEQRGPRVPWPICSFSFRFA